MSLQKDDRNVRLANAKYVAAMATALREAFGDSRSAIKTAARATGANERAVRNWFDEKNGPSGQHLVSLVRQSDRMLEAVLSLSGRSVLLDRLHADALCIQLRKLLDRLETANSLPTREF